jgi:hypothetical protein
MIDFAEDVIEAIREAGYSVEAGCTGYFVENPENTLPAMHEADTTPANKRLAFFRKGD